MVVEQCLNQMRHRVLCMMGKRKISVRFADNYMSAVLSALQLPNLFHILGSHSTATTSTMCRSILVINGALYIHLDKL
jgi:hypothetical protein